MVRRNKILMFLLIASILCAFAGLYSCRGNSGQKPMSDPSPVVSEPYWDPDPVSYDEIQKVWASHIFFGICDPNNDLLGGSIYVYLHGTNELIWPYAMMWYDFYSLPDVGDCRRPVTISVPSVFGATSQAPGMENEKLCVDLQVTDGAGHFSNMIENICVTVP